MKFQRPKGLFAGFHVDFPDPAVPELMHAGEQWAPVDFLIPEHTHSVWELYYQVDGESEWVGGGKRFVLSPGSFFAAAPGVRHRMDGQPKKRHHFFYAAIDPEKGRLGRENLLQAWRGWRVASVPRAEVLQWPFRQLIREVSTPLPHRTMGMRAALECLLIEATRVLENKHKTASYMGSHPAVVRAREMLEHHLAENWKLSSLARCAGLSPSRLSECFARDVGMSPHQYLLHVRVESAKGLLAGSDVAITDLALDLGFASSQHFASTFKRLAGMTAQTFRKRALRRSHLQR